MKNLVLILTICAFLASCRSEAQIQSSDSENSIVKVAESTQPQIKPSLMNDDMNARVGTVQSGKQSVCLRIENPNLKAGEKVQIIITQLPQKTFEAEISEKSFCEENTFGNLDDNGVTDYLLKSADRNFLVRGYGIGIVTMQKVQKEGKFAAVDLTGDKKLEYFRECTSMEGLHLTVWMGKPLVGKTVWRAYYGLGYDTVPTCKNKDFEDMND